MSSYIFKWNAYLLGHFTVLLSYSGSIFFSSTQLDTVYKPKYQRLLGAFTKLQKVTALCHVCLSNCPHGTTQLPIDGFSWNSKFVYFFKICQGNSSFIKIGHEQQVIYMKTSIHLWPNLTQFLLEWEMFQTKVVEKSKMHISYSITLFQKLCSLYDNVEKYCWAWQATDYNIIWCMHIAYWIPKATNTHSQYVILIAFPMQQWLHECTSMLCNLYTTILCLRNKPVWETHHSPAFNTKDKIKQSFSHHCPLLAFSDGKRFTFCFVTKIGVLYVTIWENRTSWKG
jgi:hypothetical protein